MLQLPYTRPEIYRIRNLLLVTGQPQVVSDICVPTSPLPGLSKAIIEANHNTLTDVCHYEFSMGTTIEKQR